MPIERVYHPLLVEYPSPSLQNSTPQRTRDHVHEHCWKVMHHAMLHCSSGSFAPCTTSCTFLLNEIQTLHSSFTPCTLSQPSVCRSGQRNARRLLEGRHWISLSSTVHVHCIHVHECIHVHVHVLNLRHVCRTWRWCPLCYCSTWNSHYLFSVHSLSYIIGMILHSIIPGHL